MTGKPINSRAKGAGGERTIARELELLTGVRFSRNLEQSRDADRSDLTPSSPDWPFSLEVKFYAAGCGCKTAWREQSERAAAKTGKIPVVIYKYNRQPIRVALPFAAIGRAFGQEWPERDWAEITLEALAYLAGEIMAERRA